MAEHQEKALQVSEQKQVELYGDEVTAVRLSDGQVYVSLSHICKALGINRASQMKRIQRNEVLAEAYQRCAIMTHHRGRQSVGVLRTDMVPLWLTGITPSKVNTELKKKLINLQRNAARILWEAFQSGELTVDNNFKNLLAQDTDAVQAYKMALAIVKLAKQQILLEGRLGDTEMRLEEVEDRLTTVEEQLTGADVVTEAQASQISQAVKAVALALGKQSGRNEFGACYGELYRKFGITSYKLMPLRKFDDAMKFLTEWHQTLVGDAPF